MIRFFASPREFENPGESELVRIQCPIAFSLGLIMPRPGPTTVPCNLIAVIAMSAHRGKADVARVRSEVRK